MIKIILRIIKQVNNNGIKALTYKVLFTLKDRLFDKYYGLDTVSWATNELVPLNQRENASPYQPTRSGSFQALLEEIKPPPKLIFIDIGSGKGKVLLMAEKYGFNCVKGIELSSGLSVIADENIKKYRKKKGVSKTQITTLNLNVLDYTFNEKQGYVIFMFNPFDEYIMRKLIKKIIKEFDFNLPLVIIYRNPKYKELFRKIPLLTHHTYYFYGDEYEVFLNDESRK